MNDGTQKTLDRALRPCDRTFCYIFGRLSPSSSSTFSFTMSSGPLAPPSDLIGQSSLYNHPDPLLRRLRLDDSSGGSITDLDTTFKGKEILILYAGSEHGSSRSRIPQNHLKQS